MNTVKLRFLVLGVAGIVILLVVLAPTVLYVVDQREMAVVLQFGDPVDERVEPGLGFKQPFVQKVHKLPNTMQFWGGNSTHILSDLPTNDDKKIEVIPWAIWKITRPTVFVQRLRTMENAQQRVAEFVRGAIRDVITQYDLSELVRTTDALLESVDIMESEENKDNELDRVEVRRTEVKKNIKFGRPSILKKIKEQAQKSLASDTENGQSGRGIELVDVGISHIEFVEQVQAETFNRWIAERKAVSAKNVNEGARIKQEILNQTRAKVEEIKGEGQKLANELRGKVDADIIRNFSKAIQTTGEFYRFVRTLEAYKKAIGKDSRLIVTTNSDFMRRLKEIGEPDRTAPATASTPADSGEMP